MQDAFEFVGLRNALNSRLVLRFLKALQLVENLNVEAGCNESNTVRGAFRAAQFHNAGISHRRG